jgi:hypothetical protein
MSSAPPSYLKGLGRFLSFKPTGSSPCGAQKKQKKKIKMITVKIVLDNNSVFNANKKLEKVK